MKIFTYSYINTYISVARRVCHSSTVGSSSQASNKYESRESLIMQIGRIQWGIVFGCERGSTIRGRTAGQPCDLWGSAEHDNWIRLASAECKMGFLFSLQSRTGANTMVKCILRWRMILSVFCISFFSDVLRVYSLQDEGIF